MSKKEWATDLAAALEEAKTSKRLVLVCFNMDGEQANERALEVYRSAEFAKATAQVICVLCSADDHQDTGQCSRFHTCTCSAHRAAEKQARRHFFGANAANVAPQHILLFPEGQVAWHAVYEVAASAIYKAIEGAEKMKGQTPAQRTAQQRAYVDQLKGKADKNVEGAYLQLQAALAQLSSEVSAECFGRFGKELALRVVNDLEGYPRERALAKLRACKHSNKAVAQALEAVRGRVEARQETAPAKPVPAEANSAKPLAEPLSVLGPADEFSRVYWSGAEQNLASHRDHITVVWFFLLDSVNLAEHVASMNEFAAANADRGIRTIGLTSCQRASEAVERLAALGANFPVGAYAALSGHKMCGVECFPSWVVLDPETNIVHRSPQDGRAFEWMEARRLAERMAESPSYTTRLVVRRAR